MSTSGCFSTVYGPHTQPGHVLLVRLCPHHSGVNSYLMLSYSNTLAFLTHCPWSLVSTFLQNTRKLRKRQNRSMQCELRAVSRLTWYFRRGINPRPVGRSDVPHANHGDRAEGHGAVPCSDVYIVARFSPSGLQDSPVNTRRPS